jgi:hypothetical protein
MNNDRRILMLNDPCSVDHALQILNEMLAADPDAAKSLVETRVLCNEVLADHLTIQVMGDPDGFRVGLLGVLNGIFGTEGDGGGPIAAHFETVCPNPDCNFAGDDDEDAPQNCPSCGAPLVERITRFIRREV